MFMENEVLNLFDNFDEDLFAKMNIPDIMRTDIYELDGKILFEVELPGYEIPNISADLNDGYLTILASKTKKIESGEEKRGYIKRERHIGGCKRKYYVGTNVNQKDVHASYKHGILKIMIDLPDKAIEDKRKYIEIH